MPIMSFHFILSVSIMAITEAFDIQSERVTNWGTWGSWDECPPGSFVKAINVKVESKLGDGDDTAMNAVHLSCVELEKQVTRKVLKSAEGKWGHFTGMEYCNRGVAVGFQLRSEGKQGSGDDTAANDMVLVCANKHGKHLTTEKGQDWGSWRSTKYCPPRTAVCGLRTQVEPHQKSGDDSSLNNVDLRCCELPDPAKSCRPSDSWEVVFKQFNSKGRTAIKYTLSEKVGVQKSSDFSSSSSVMNDIATSVGFEAGITTKALKFLGLTFETKLQTSSKTEHTWSRTESSVFRSERKETTELTIPAGCDTTYYQLVGRCGPYEVKSNVKKRIDNCSNGTHITYNR